MGDNLKKNNICFIGITKVDKKEKGIESLTKEVIARDQPNLAKELGILIEGFKANHKTYHNQASGHYYILVTSGVLLHSLTYLYLSRTKVSDVKREVEGKESRNIRDGDGKIEE